MVRGALDVPGTIRLRAAGSESVASKWTLRSLDHAASRAIVAAYAVLRQWMAPLGQGERTWLPSRARDLVPHLVAVTGPRPAVPTPAELRRVRYTPITMPFRAVAELSRRIALQRGLLSDHSPDGSSTGILLDVAELWELYVLAALRRAASGLEVRHGTADLGARESLLISESTGAEIGTLKPDAVVFRRGVPVAVVDAKYKRLTPRASAPYGPERSDLYQLSSYLVRYGRDVSTIQGALIYPRDPEGPSTAPVEAGNPWRLERASQVRFLTLPHDLVEASAMLREHMHLEAGVGPTAGRGGRRREAESFQSYAGGRR